MMSKKVFGLDISDNSIEVLLLSKPLLGRPKVISYGRRVLTGELIKNGQIKKPKLLAAAIKKTLAEAKPNKITTKLCILSLPESQVFTAVFKLPAGLKRDEIKSTIPFKAEEIIPFKATEIYFDFKTLTVKGSTQEVFYVAVPTKIVDGYVVMLEEAGLQPLAFDLESVSLSRSVVKSSSGKDATLLIDIGARATNLNIFDRNGIRQGRTIQIAGNRFTKSIASQLKLTPKAAAERKMNTGFDPKKGQGKGKVLLILQKEFSRIISEAKQLIDYYQTESQRKVGRAVLAGGSSLLPKVDQYLADNLGMEVLLGQPFHKIADPKKLLKQRGRALLYANVAGLALRGVRKNPIKGDLNLMPARKRFAFAPAKGDKKNWRLVYIRLAVFLILVVVFLGIIVAKRGGYDPYQKLYPPANFQSDNVGQDVNYELLDQLRNQEDEELATTTATTTDELAQEEEEEEVIEEFVRVQAVPGGLLNVREGSSTQFSIVTKITEGEEYLIIGEEEGWYNIQLDEEAVGWVFGAYVDKFIAEE